MSTITDVVTEMSVANESNTYALVQSPGASGRALRGSPFTAGPIAGTPAGDAPDVRSAVGFSAIQAEDMRKSLRDVEKHVRKFTL